MIYPAVEEILNWEQYRQDTTVELIASEKSKFEQITDDDERGNITKTIQLLKEEQNE